ncbi:phosphotransferase [Streptomyces sp. MZ04]|uniref:phosphotransferase n=1 Tax=Streptomyces sp. MZ04 TaxID=2559236 RepID=UPI0014331B58|nr:phosphotransferase [Streptomyces sp. MZ04]
MADAYALGEVPSVRYLAEGLLNRNWKITTDQGTFALKEVVNTPVDKLLRSLTVLSALEAAGLPVCAPHLSPASEPLVTVGDRSYCLLPLVEGNPAVPLGPVGERPRAKVTAPKAALAEADRFLGGIAQWEAPDAFDQATEPALHQRKKLIAENADQGPVDEAPRGRWGWTHGDFQPLNVLWRQGAVVSAFVTGYRSQRDLADADLTDAVERLWWKRLTDYWQLQFHYDKHDFGADALWGGRSYRVNRSRRRADRAEGA